MKLFPQVYLLNRIQIWNKYLKVDLVLTTTNIIKLCVGILNWLTSSYNSKIIDVVLDRSFIKEGYWRCFLAVQPVGIS